MKNLLFKILFVIDVYTMGVFVGLTVMILRTLGVIKVLNWNRLPKYGRSPELFKNGLIVVCNHPSLLEPITVSGLFFGHYFWHPFKLSPWNIAEERNYKNRWWEWASPRIVWIDRSSSKKSREAFRETQNILRSGGVVIIFPEGGRTEGGKTSPTSEKDFLYAKRGGKIRPLKEGVGLLAKRTNASVLFLWTSGSESVMPNIPGKLYSFPRLIGNGGVNRILIKVGGVLRFNAEESASEITQKIACELLRLADE
ncbi:MAG: 1-acyl-sn-glycerol-3-phosphate acyltransferase [Candidatus Nealsonbacteria bacterium]|nr:1-acyl-sn-glycerol-3-phosphate acyltransferase [Candidatus Nealsonbacteria bacterium]